MNTIDVSPLIMQLNTMFALQDSLNSKVSETWKSNNYEWYRAMWTESAELMEHYGWKWWKKQSPDQAQVQLELIDIWHFGLSDMLQNSKDNIHVLVTRTKVALEQPQYYTDFKEALEVFTRNVLTLKEFDILTFVDLMRITGMTTDQLYSSYLGKNVLNFFRQDHGYKDGSYFKVWDGKEDNEHLAEIIATADVTDPNLKDKIYSELENRYPK